VEALKPDDILKRLDAASLRKDIAGKGYQRSLFGSINRHYRNLLLEADPMEGLTTTSPKENVEIVYRQIAYVVYFRRFIATLNACTWDETQAYFHEFLLFRLQPDFFPGLVKGRQMNAPFHWFVFMRFVQHYRIFQEPTMRTQTGRPSASSGSGKRLWIAGYMGPGTHASRLALYNGKSNKGGGMSKCNLIAYLKWLKKSASDLQEHASF